MVVGLMILVLRIGMFVCICFILWVWDVLILGFLWCVWIVIWLLRGFGVFWVCWIFLIEVWIWFGILVLIFEELRIVWYCVILLVSKFLICVLSWFLVVFVRCCIVLLLKSVFNRCWVMIVDFLVILVLVFDNLLVWVKMMSISVIEILLMLKVMNCVLECLFMFFLVMSFMMLVC